MGTLKETQWLGTRNTWASVRLSNGTQLEFGGRFLSADIWQRYQPWSIADLESANVSDGRLFPVADHFFSFVALDLSIWAQNVHFRFEQALQLPTSQLLGQLGGYAGLFLGVSGITLLQYVEIAFIVLARRCRG